MRVVIAFLLVANASFILAGCEAGTDNPLIGSWYGYTPDSSNLWIVVFKDDSLSMQGHPFEPAQYDVRNEEVVIAAYGHTTTVTVISANTLVFAPDDEGRSWLMHRASADRIRELIAEHNSDIQEGDSHSAEAEDD